MTPGSAPTPKSKSVLAPSFGLAQAPGHSGWDLQPSPHLPRGTFGLSLSAPVLLPRLTCLSGSYSSPNQDFLSQGLICSGASFAPIPEMLFRPFNLPPPSSSPLGCRGSCTDFLRRIVPGCGRYSPSSRQHVTVGFKQIQSLPFPPLGFSSADPSSRRASTQLCFPDPRRRSSCPFPHRMSSPLVILFPPLVWPSPAILSAAQLTLHLCLPPCVAGLRDQLPG